MKIALSSPDAAGELDPHEVPRQAVPGNEVAGDSAKRRPNCQPLR